MTREEAVELLCYGDWLSVISEHIGKMDTERIAEAMSIVGKALRPVSREQVEKAWRGEWRSIHGLSEYYCSRCGEEFEIHAYDKDKYQFCPHCMAPMTDDAVQMVMERMEALKDGKGDND